ncbi:MAG TPA: MarR family transcriptional regulator [Herpetosiphonaceae bacterium]|nr:MarR family transcriptional regulator [Herpetosiphonaceae bacterium]
MNGLAQRDYETLAAFRYHLRRFLRFSERAAGEVGVPAQQHQALLAIKGSPAPGPMSIGELAEHLQIRHHSAVELVDRLVAQEFVRREAGADRRSVALALTERGEGILEQLALIHRDELQRIAPLLRDLLGQLERRDNQ